MKLKSGETIQMDFVAKQPNNTLIVDFRLKFHQRKKTHVS